MKQDIQYSRYLCIGNSDSCKIQCTITLLQKDIKKLRNKEMFNAIIERKNTLAEAIKDITYEYCVNMSLVKVSLEKLDSFIFAGI